jgi:hypothetical protein
MSTDHPERSDRAKSNESDEEAMAEGYIPDSQLPEDLRPEENPLAAPPDDSDDSEDSDESENSDGGADEGRRGAQDTDD